MRPLLAQNPEDAFNLASPVLGTPFRNLALIFPQNAFAFVVNALLIIGGGGFFIYLLWGGVQWITAGGDKEGVEKARKKITQSLVGLGVLFSAYAIMSLVDMIFLGGSGGLFNLTIPSIVNP